MADKRIKPVQVLPDKVEVTSELVVPDGMAYIMEVRDGKEVEGSGFTYPAKTAEKYFGDKTKFIIKKKVTQ